MVGKSFPILFIAPTTASEAVLASGLLKKLFDEAPNPSFTIIANRTVAPLFSEMPKVANLAVTERRGSRRRWLGLFGPMRARRWALVIDAPSGLIAGRLRPRGPLRRSPADEPTHKLIEAARLMRLEDNPPAPYLFTSAATEARAEALTGGRTPILALGPGAEWQGKAWPIERFAETARRLLGMGGPLMSGRLMLVGAAADQHEVEPLRSITPKSRLIDLVGKTDLLTAYAALRRARLFIGNDNAYTQLAGAAGAPSLALFGPSDDQVWRPWGDEVRVVRGSRTFEEILKIDPSLSATVRHMVDLSVDSVTAAAEQVLEETVG